MKDIALGHVNSSRSQKAQAVKEIEQNLMWVDAHLDVMGFREFTTFNSNVATGIRLIREDLEKALIPAARKQGLFDLAIELNERLNWWESLDDQQWTIFGSLTSSPP